MMKIRGIVCLAGMMAAGGACARPYAPPPPLAPMQGSESIDWRAVLGCWRMSETMVLALDSVPAVTRFVRREGARQGRVIPAPAGVGDMLWRTTDRNTIEFLTGDGLHGAMWEFVLREGRLEGRQTTITDIVIEGVEWPVEAVVAEREPCPDAAASTSP
jgi:hypothetical protein